MSQREQGEMFFRKRKWEIIKKNTTPIRPSPMAAEVGSGGGGGSGDRKSSPVPTKPGGGGAGKFLPGMPLRGNFSSASILKITIFILILAQEMVFTHSCFS
jgi:hypothetical protein